MRKSIAKLTMQQCIARLKEIDDFLQKPDLFGKPRNEWESEARDLIRRVCRKLERERILICRHMANLAVVRMKPANGWRVLVLSPKCSRRGFLWQRAHAAETIPLLVAFAHFFEEVKLMRTWYPNKIDHTFRVRMVAPCGTVVAEERLKRQEFVLKSDLYTNG